jgi:hypothetical protein
MKLIMVSKTTCGNPVLNDILALRCRSGIFAPWDGQFRCARFRQAATYHFSEFDQRKKAID